MTLKTISSIILYLLYFLLIATPIFTICQWIIIDHPHFGVLISHYNTYNPIFNSNGAIINIDNLHLNIVSKLIGIIGCTIGILPFFLSIIRLIKIFKRYRNNKIFNKKNTKSYKILGYLLVFDGLFAKPIANLLLVLCATLSNYKGHRYIVYNISIANLEIVFCGFIIIAIAKVMSVGHQLQEEQNSVI
jgi:hypothetical protein